MSSDAYTAWSGHSLDSTPDVSVLAVLRSGEAISPRLDVVAAHFAVRQLTWEFVAVALDAEPDAPLDDRLANAFVVDRGPLDDRLDPLRRASTQASGQRVLLTGADLSAAIVHLDEVVARLDDGADIVVGWPYPDGVTPVGSDLPTFVGCSSGVMRALGDTRSVYGGSTFADALQVAHFWGLDVHELQVDVAVVDTTASPANSRPAGRVVAGPSGSPVL